MERAHDMNTLTQRASPGSSSKERNAMMVVCQLAKDKLNVTFASGKGVSDAPGQAITFSRKIDAWPLGPPVVPFDPLFGGGFPY